MGKNKTTDFSESIVVYDIKVGRCSQLGDCMKFYEYKWSRSFTDLGPDHSDSNFLNFFSSITLSLTYPQHSGERYRTSGPVVKDINLWYKFWQHIKDFIYFHICVSVPERSLLPHYFI